MNKGTFRFDGQVVEVARGHNLFRALQAAGVVMPSRCDGGGSCGDCVIEILSGENALDMRTSEERSLPRGLRRACRAHWLHRDEDVESVSSNHVFEQSAPTEGGRSAH